MRLIKWKPRKARTTCIAFYNCFQIRPLWKYIVLHIPLVRVGNHLSPLRHPMSNPCQCSLWNANAHAVAVLNFRVGNYLFKIVHVSKSETIHIPPLALHIDLFLKAHQSRKNLKSLFVVVEKKICPLKAWFFHY